MDIITQAILGAAVGELVMGPKLGNKALVIGAVGGIIPDLDIAFLPFYDDLQRISIHRGISHSIFFSVLGAGILAWGLHRWSRWKEVTFLRWYLLSFLALFTHILIDAFTSYGTQLFQPFSDRRIGFDSISIVDPVYTIPLLIGVLGVIFSNKRSARRRYFNYFGLGISSLYLVFTLFNKRSIDQVFERSLVNQNIPHEKFMSVPVSFGNLLWYGVAKGNDGLYIGNYSILDNDQNIRFEYFPVNEDLLNSLDEKLADRMKWFAKDFYVVIKYRDKLRFYNLQCDMQGIQNEKYKAPTAFYFEITTHPDGSYELVSGMHHTSSSMKDKWKRVWGKVSDNNRE